MGVYAVTGSASGMGGAVASKLRAAGHTIIGVDIDASADVVADLSTASGRAEAAEKVLAAAGGRLDGAVLAAGLGPMPGRDRPRLITQVNYFGVVELLRAWRPALAKADAAKVVVFSSNSTTTVPLVPRRAVRALLAGDGPAALKAVGLFGPKMAPVFAYAASKIALSHWLRTAAVSPAWIGEGIRLNAIAPGAILTPLLEKQLATPSEAKQIKSFPVPAGGYGDPSHLGDWVVFMLSDAASFLCGSVIFVDGGTDAYYRPTDWPRPVPLAALPGYLRRMRAWRARKLRFAGRERDRHQGHVAGTDLALLADLLQPRVEERLADVVQDLPRPAASLAFAEEPGGQRAGAEVEPVPWPDGSAGQGGHRRDLFRDGVATAHERGRLAGVACFGRRERLDEPAFAHVEEAGVTDGRSVPGAVGGDVRDEQGGVGRAFQAGPLVPAHRVRGELPSGHVVLKLTGPLPGGCRHGPGERLRVRGHLRAGLLKGRGQQPGPASGQETLPRAAGHRHPQRLIRGRFPDPPRILIFAGFITVLRGRPDGYLGMHPAILPLMRIPSNSAISRLLSSRFPSLLRHYLRT